MLVAGKEVGILPAHIQRLLQGGLHAAEVVGRPRLGPQREGLRHVARKRRSKFGGHLGAPLVVAACHAHQGGIVVVGRQAVGIGLQFVEQAADGGIGGGLMCQPLERRHLAGAAGSPGGRHVRGLVPAQHGVGRGDVIGLAQPGNQFVPLLLYLAIHVKSFRISSCFSASIPLRHISLFHAALSLWQIRFLQVYWNGFSGVIVDRGRKQANEKTKTTKS